MGNTTVDPTNGMKLCCSFIKENDKNKKIENAENGKFSVEQGEETLEISLSTEKCTINEFGEIIKPDGTKTGAKMSKTEHMRYTDYRASIEKKIKQQLKDGLEH